jgi:hypothetical protein
MGLRSGVWALCFAVGCAAAEEGLVRPSAVDPGLAALDGDPDRSHAYPVVSIDRYDGFLAEAARVDATVELARRLGGELRTEVVRLAEDKGLARAERRPWTALARELAGRDDLTAAERERLGEAAEPLAVLLPHVATLAPRVERLIEEGEGLFEEAHRDLSYDEEKRLARALDAVNVAVVRLRAARARVPVLEAELGPALQELGRIDGPGRHRQARVEWRRTGGPGDGG